MLGLGSNMMKHPVTGKSIVRDGLVLQHNYNLSSVEPLSSGAAYFVESNTDYISVSDAASLSFDACSFSAWIYVSDATNFPIIGKGAYNSTAEYQLKVQSDDKIHFWVADESVASCHIGRATPTITSYENQWIHVAGTYDGGTASSGLKIYINGVQSDDANDESNAGSFVAMENLAANVEIGKYSSTYGDGYMCNVGVWNAALSQAQVKSIMNKNYDSLSASEKTNLVSWWNLDSVIPDTTNTVYDNHYGGGEALGTDKVTDGTFINGLASWTTQGVTESGGVVTFDADASTDYMFQNISYTDDKVYAITLEGTGDAKIRVGYSGIAGTQIVFGTLPTTLNLFVDSTASRIQIYKNSGDEMLLTSVSVKEINGNTGTLS